MRKRMNTNAMHDASNALQNRCFAHHLRGVPVRSLAWRAAQRVGMASVALDAESRRCA
jgi:hypothetical protein